MSFDNTVMSATLPGVSEPVAQPAVDPTPLVRIANVSKHFGAAVPERAGTNRVAAIARLRAAIGRVLDPKHAAVVRAVTDVSLDIRRGETLGLVGESGCGKSTLGRTLLRLLQPTAGTITFDASDVTRLSPPRLPPIRPPPQTIFPDP